MATFSLHPHMTSFLCVYLPKVSSSSLRTLGITLITSLKFLILKSVPWRLGLNIRIYGEDTCETIQGTSSGCFFHCTCGSCHWLSGLVPCLLRTHLDASRLPVLSRSVPKMKTSQSLSLPLFLPTTPEEILLSGSSHLHA